MTATSEPALSFADALAEATSAFGVQLGLDPAAFAEALLIEGATLLGATNGRAASAAKLRELADLIDLASRPPAGHA